eukprot:g1149.t1
MEDSQVWSDLRNDVISFCFKDTGLHAVTCASMSALENAMNTAIKPVPATSAKNPATCTEVEMEQLCRNVCAAADLKGQATQLRLMRLLLAEADALWKGVSKGVSTSTPASASAVSCSFVSMAAESALQFALSKSKVSAAGTVDGVSLSHHTAAAGAWRKRCTAAAEWLRAVMLLALLGRPTRITVPVDVARQLQDYAIGIGTSYPGTQLAHSGNRQDLDVAQLHGALEIAAAKIIGRLSGMAKRYARSACTALTRSLEKWPRKRGAGCAEELRLLRFWEPNWKAETQYLMDNAMKPLLDGASKRSSRDVVAAAADVFDRVLQEALHYEAQAHDCNASSTLCVHISSRGKDSPRELVSMIRCYSTAACAQQRDIWCANDGKFCREHIEHLVHFALRVERLDGKDLYKHVRREALQGILRFSERLLWTGRSLEDEDARDEFGRAVEVSVIEVLKTTLFLPQSTDRGSGQQDARGMRNLTQLVRSDDWEHLRAIVLKIAEFKPRWTLIEFIRKLLAVNPMAESTECLRPCTPETCSYDAQVFLGLTALHGLHEHWQKKKIEKAQRESLPGAQSYRNARKSLTFNVRMTVVKLGRQLDDVDNKRFFGQCIGSALQALKMHVDQIEYNPPTSGSSQVQVHDCVFFAAMQCLEFLVPTADTFTQVQVMELIVRCCYTQALHCEVRRCAEDVVERILLKHNSCVLFEAFSNFTRTTWTPDMNPFIDADDDNSQARKQFNTLARLAELVEGEQCRRVKAMSSPFHSSDLEAATSPWKDSGVFDDDDSHHHMPLIHSELQHMFDIVQHLEESAMLGLCCIDAKARKAAMRLLRAVHCLRETLIQQDSIQTGAVDGTESLEAAIPDTTCDQITLYEVFERIATEWADQQKSKCGAEMQRVGTEKQWKYDEKYGSYDLQILVSGGGEERNDLTRYTALEERWSRCLLYAMDTADDDVIQRLQNIWQDMKRRADMLDASIETAHAIDLDGGHLATKCVADHCFETRGADTKALLSVLFDNAGEPSRWAESDCDLPVGCNTRHRDQLELPREACHAMQALLCGGKMLDDDDACDNEGAIYDVVHEGSDEANNVIENVFRWADKLFKLLKQEQRYDLAHTSPQSSTRAVYGVQQKVIEILRAFILMNSAAVTLQPCIMRCSAFIWNGEKYVEAEDQDLDVMSSSYFRVLADIVCHVTESSQTLGVYAGSVWNEISDVCTLSRVLKLALLNVAHEHDRTLRECGLSLVRQLLILERHFGSVTQPFSGAAVALNATMTKSAVVSQNWSQQHADLLAGTAWDNRCVRGCSDIQTPFGHVHSTDLMYACEQQQLLQAATLSLQISRISANFLIEIFECLRQASLSICPVITSRQQRQLLRLTIPWLRCGSFGLHDSKLHADREQLPAHQILPLPLLFDVTEHLMNQVLLPQTQDQPSSLFRSRNDQPRAAISSEISVNDIRQVWITLTDSKPENVEAIVSFLCGDGGPNDDVLDLMTSRHIAVWCAHGALHETVEQLSNHVWDEHTTREQLKENEIPEIFSLRYRPSGANPKQHEVDQIGEQLIRRAHVSFMLQSHYGIFLLVRLSM